MKNRLWDTAETVLNIVVGHTMPLLEE